MMEPLVSIVTPFLDTERFLAEAIESVVGQSYDHWELWLVDDGSTDGSRDIARSYAGRHPGRIRVLEHPEHENRGISASRNLAIHRSAGEYVAFLDSDDVWLPRKLEQQVEILRSHPRAALVYGRSEYWHSWSGGPAEDHVPELGVHVEADTLIEPPNLLLVNYPLGEAAAPPPSSLVLRRAAILRAGGFEESFRGIHQLYEDQALLVKIYLREAVYPAHECWERYRVRGDSCVSRVTGEGHYPAARHFFLKWFAGHLREQGVEDPEVWQALEMALWPYQTNLECHARTTPREEARPMTRVSEPRSSRYEGHHDVASCEAISGWAWDAARPQVALGVEIHDGENLLVALRANKFRKDLRDAGKGDGYHAFTCPLPPWLQDGEPHSIRVTVAGSDFELPATPRTIRCPPRG